jgi:hypothetical protein
MNMFLHAKHAPDARCGIVIDIGSASVASAIVVSEPDEPQPTVVWSHIERCAISEAPDTVALAKKVSTALLNVSLEIANQGLKTLMHHDARLRPTTTQVAITAPWTYTVPKRIQYAQDEPFTVTESLVNDLIRTAEQETTQAQSASPLFESFGLSVISSSTSHFTANGYTVTDPIGQHTPSLTLVRKVSICQKRLLDSIQELHESIAPRSTLQISSFMEHMQHQVLTKTIPSRTYGLIDISGDATEVGIVVDGVLENVASNTWGHYGVAREIAMLTQEPLMSAFARLQSLTNQSTLGISPSQQETCTRIMDTFSSKIADCISTAAQRIELPSHYVVHSDTGLAGFARNTSIAAVNQLTHNTDTSVALVSEKLLDTVTVEESRLALSIAVFHTSGPTA